TTTDPEYRTVTPKPLTVTVTDDEPEPSLTLSPSAIRVVEGRTATLTASLASPLPTAVTIPLVVSRTTAEPADLAVPAGITIAARQKQATVTLRTRHDSDADHEVLFIEPGRVPEPITGATANLVTVHITDDEYVPSPAKVACDATSGRCEAGTLPIGEGRTRTLYLTLRQQPTHPVTATATVAKGDGDVTTQSSVAFSTTRYADKSFTVTGAEDTSKRELDQAEIILRFASTDPFYDGKEMTLRLQVVDNDTPIVLRLEQHGKTLSLPEDGSVRLTVTASRAVPFDVTPEIELWDFNGDFSPGDLHNPADAGVNADATGVTLPTIRTGRRSSEVVLDAADDNLVEADALVYARLQPFNGPLVSVDVDGYFAKIAHIDDDRFGVHVHRHVTDDNGTPGDPSDDTADYELFIGRRTEFPLKVHLRGKDHSHHREFDVAAAADSPKGYRIPLPRDVGDYEGIAIELPKNFQRAGQWARLDDGIELIGHGESPPGTFARPLAARDAPDDMVADILHPLFRTPAEGRISVVAVSDVTGSGFTVGWNAVDGADGYEVRWQPVGEAQPSAARTSATEYAVTGLTAGVDYQVRIMVIEEGSAVASKSSRTVTVTTVGTPPKPKQPEISVTAAAGITEGGSASFTVTATPAPAAPLRVQVAVSQTGDYAASGTAGTKTVTIPVSGSAVHAVATDDDSTDEPDGSITVTVNTGKGYTVASAQGTATVAVADNDDPVPTVPVIGVTADGDITEGGTAMFTVTASPAPAKALSVYLRVSTTGDIGLSGTLHIVTVPVSGTVRFAAATTGDLLDEPDGSITVTLEALSGYTVSATQGSATVAVADDDDPPSTADDDPPSTADDDPPVDADPTPDADPPVDADPPLTPTPKVCVTADATLLAQVKAKTA
ncbi:MAG: fibronectin type III domain-containing protein, partial [bacterium]|nr:fibronectin type III domain-containing protein [bacterium]